MPISKNQFMEIAEVISRSSHANRLKVGAVAVVDNRIVATGYNGTPPNMSNECEDENGKTKECVVHAEVNLVAFASKHGVKISGSDVFCTHACCVACASVLGSAGIRSFNYGADYRDPSGLQLLSDLGIKVEQIKPVVTSETSYVPPYVYKILGDADDH